MSERDAVLVQAKAEPALVADGAEDARRVVYEGEVVEHAQAPGGDVLTAAEGIDKPPEIARLERYRHRVDCEISAE